MSEPEPAPDYEHEPTPEDKHDIDDIEDIVPVPYQRPDDAAVPLIRFLKEPGTGHYEEIAFVAELRDQLGRLV
jgi:hypothetical protein